MDSALAGIIGAAGGAALGGGAKIFQDHLAHRLASRTAARILVVSLRGMQSDAASALKLGTWRIMDERWKLPLELCAKHQEALGRVLGADDFETVAFVFWNVALVQPSLPVPAAGVTAEVITLKDHDRELFENLHRDVGKAIEVLSQARLSPAEKTRALADLDRAPPIGKAEPDAGGPIGGPDC